MGQLLSLLYSGNRDYKIKEIVVVENVESCHGVVARLYRECNNSFPVLGMDCEWVPDIRPGEKHPVALLQLATVNGFCALFRLSHMREIPKPLKSILGHEKILKVGVAIQNDVNRLGFNVRGWVDIRHLECLLVMYPVKDSAEGSSDGSNMKLGLASLAKKVLGIELDKGVGIRLCKWDSEILSEDQITYAAWDAFAAVLISYELTHQDVAVQACSLKSPVDFLWNYKECTYGENAGTSRRPLHNQGVGNKGATLSKKSNRVSVPSRKTPMYDNIFLLAPDGEILCTCDKKRAMWYVEKGIGEIIEEKNCTENNQGVDGNSKTCLKVQLKFEPSRRAIDESEKYYCLVKNNHCVVCGKEDSYLRKHIVPHEYRKFFPVWMKSHQSHDVLLLCVNCHIQSNCLDLKLRQKLSQDCDAPLNVDKSKEVQDAQMVKKVQSAAKALSRQPTSIPEKRRQELEDIILSYFSSRMENELPKSSVTPDMLKDAMGLMSRVTNEAHIPHGLKVVKHFQETIGEEDGLRELEVLWRQHFVDEMRPRFLPALWSLRHFRMSPNEKNQEKIQCEGLQISSNSST